MADENANESTSFHSWRLVASHFLKLWMFNHSSRWVQYQQRALLMLFKRHVSPKKQLKEVWYLKSLATILVNTKQRHNK